MSSDEEVAFAAIAAVAQAKIGQYSPLLGAGSSVGMSQKGSEDESTQAVGTDAKALALMLVKEEKKVLSDLRIQLMSEVGLLLEYPDVELYRTSMVALFYTRLQYRPDQLTIKKRIPCWRRR